MDLVVARPTDLRALHTLIEAAYRGDSARLGWCHEADLIEGQRTDLDALDALVADPNQRLLLFPDGAAPVACVALTDKGDGLVYLGLLTVDPTRQADGLGRRLLAAAEEEARTMFAAVRIEMTVVMQRSELIAWYERRGYALTGERRPFPSTDPRFGLPKRDDLEFVVLEKRL